MNEREDGVVTSSRTLRSTRRLRTRPRRLRTRPRLLHRRRRSRRLPTRTRPGGNLRRRTRAPTPTPRRTRPHRHIGPHRPHRLHNRHRAHRLGRLRFPKPMRPAIRLRVHQIAPNHDEVRILLEPLLLPRALCVRGPAPPVQRGVGAEAEGAAEQRGGVLQVALLAVDPDVGGDGEGGAEDARLGVELGGAEEGFFLVGLEAEADVGGGGGGGGRF